MEDTKTTQAWNDRIESFANSVGKTAEEINNALKPLVGEPGDEALSIISDPTSLSDDDIKGVLVLGELKIPLGVFNKHLPKLRGPVVVSADSRSTGSTFDAILPTIPEDNSFLEMLKVGGNLKVDTTAVISAVKAAIAERLHVFDLPSLIKQKMEDFAEQQEEPVGETYYRLQKMVTSRSYADVLSVMGIEGNFMSQAKTKKFLQKVDEHLWPALQNFHTLLDQWQESWIKAAGNPGIMMSMLVMGQTGNKNAISATMMNPPETNGLHDEAEAVINKINKVFAGEGIAVSRALAYDATRIKGVLSEKGLPETMGAATNEQMIKMLGMNVGADFVRLERNIARYTMSIMEFPKITVPGEEQAYLAAMLQLGAAIPWDKLIGKGISVKL